MLGYHLENTVDFLVFFSYIAKMYFDINKSLAILFVS